MYKERANHNWTEKYRPNNLEELVADEYIKKTISGYITNKSIPHLLLYGLNPGTGKTTLAKIIINSVDCDELIINASDERTTDVIENKIKMFATTLGFNQIKIVLLDEFDGTMPSAQQMLRFIMEEYSSLCTFILTCNHLNNVIMPIQSRCNTIEILPPNKEMVKKRITDILLKEKIIYNEIDVDKIIENAFPDIRKIISLTQMFSQSEKLLIDKKKLIETDYKLKILEVLKSTNDKKIKYNKIDKILRESNEKDYSSLYTMLYDKVDEYAPTQRASITNIISDGLFKQSFINNKEIQASATMSKIIIKISE